MIDCKKHIIAAGFSLMLPLAVWAEAPVVDDSEEFAMIDGQQVAQAPAGHSRYDDQPLVDNSQINETQNEHFSTDGVPSDDGPALVQDDRGADANTINDNAKLIDKIQSLQREIQELRGQLEVQAHDLKLLQQQQVAFYKDLDARIASGKSIEAKPATDLTLSTKKTNVQPTNSTVTSTPAKNAKSAIVPQPVNPASRINPADEQISYMAAYELVKNKQYDNAINAMHLFVKKYPNGGYSANAQYWLGELYLVKKDYPKSIEHFEIVLHQFPSSSKSAASLLKSGYAYAASGNQQEAKKRFQEVVKTYPGTPTAQLAHSKLESLNAL